MTVEDNKTVMTVEDNKTAVRAFYQTPLNDRDADTAVPNVGTSCRRHNPPIEDGYEGLRRYLDWLRENFLEPCTTMIAREGRMEFDYIVIGAGSAGCAVAARLSFPIKLTPPGPKGDAFRWGVVS